MKRLLPLIALAAFAAPVSADNWPQWRGPKFDGHSAEKGLPAEWSGEKNVVWKLKMPGIGACTPVVWGDNVFVTSVDGDDVVVLCVGTDGKEKWKEKLSNTGAKRYKNPSGADVSDASPSCATDGKHVWASASNGAVACFTVAGKQVWTADLNKYGKGKIAIAFGSHWTPVLYKGTLYFQVMHRNAQMLVALEAATGKELWKVERPGYSKGESPDVYASATIWEGKDGAAQLIAHGNDFTTGHKLTDGTELWRVMELNPGEKKSGAWRFVSNVLTTPDLIVVPSCKNGPLVALDPAAAKGDITPENKAELWRITPTPDVVAPVRVGDTIYLCQHGPFLAVDAKTGKQLYRENVAKGYHWSNMVVADGKIYTSSQDGVTTVIEAGSTFKKIATNTLPDKLFGTPALADGRIYIRGYGYLWAIGTK
ncbi:MAG: PQQ-like beta-propeller repeat protein [Planctomycetes bacterium]|nr:PQQ-like beta-propeller repeat protein [Planctomycetota bacterium]